MLIVPYLIGAIITEGSVGAEIAGLIGLLLLFFSRAPLALLLKSRAVDGSFGPHSSSRWLNFSMLAAAGTLIFLYLMIANGLWRLIIVAAAGAGLFLMHEWIVWRRRERSVTGELIGVALLTLTAPVAVLLSAWESWWLPAVCLWLLNAMYFGSSVFYIKMRLRTSARGRKPGDMRGKVIAAKGLMTYTAIVLMMLALLAVADATPKLAAISFIPMVCYQAWGVITGAPGMTLKAEGISQALLSVLFTLLLVGVYKV